MAGAENNTDLVSANNQLIKAVNDLCGCLQVTVTSNVTVGVTIQMAAGTEGGSPPVGAGPPDPITDRECKMAEVLYDDMETILSNFANNPFSVTFFDAVTISLFLAPLVENGVLFVADRNNSILGWLIDLAYLVITLDASISYANMQTQWQANKSDIICAMYNGTTPGAIRAQINSVLSGVTTQAERDFITHALTNDVLNALWFSVGNSETVLNAFTGTFDCSTCGSCTGGSNCGQYTWNWTAGSENWTFVDRSFGAGTPTCTGAWNPGGYHTIVGTTTNPPNDAAKGAWVLDLSARQICANVGDTFFGHFRLAQAQNMNVHVIVIYADDTFDSTTVLLTSQTWQQVSKTLTQNKHIKQLEVEADHSTGPPFTLECQVDLAATILSSSPECPP